MRVYNVPGHYSESFESALISHINAVDTSECIMKGSLSDYEILLVKTDELTTSSIKEQQSRVVQDKEKIKQICKKYDLKCSFNECSKYGSHSGLKCLITSTDYLIYLYKSDIVRLKTLFFKNRIDEVNSKTREVQEFLEKGAYSSSEIEKFKNSSLFLHISKDINNKIAQEIVSKNLIKRFYISIVIYVNAIKINISCPNPAMSIFSRTYIFASLGYKSIENRKQENTIYCAFIDYYKKHLNFQHISFYKLEYSSGLEEYGSGTPSVSIHFNVEGIDKLKDLF